MKPRHLAAAFVLACSFVTAAQAATPGRVTVITDSVGGVLQWNESGHGVLARGIDLDVESRVCRRLVDPGCNGDPPPPSALDTIRDLGPSIGETVVVDVGYNDVSSTYGAGIDETMALLAASGVRNVVWVTLAETQGVWRESNAAIRAAPSRWPQLTVAEWATASAGRPWFVDAAHLTAAGGTALATFLRPIVLRACGDGCALFCGLVRTANGFDAIQTAGADCEAGRAAIVAAERGAPGDWVCSRALRGPVELDCLRDGMHARVLERAPLPAVRYGRTAWLGGWAFRLRGDALDARHGDHGWLRVARAPFCVPDVPREVLVALGLRPLTPHGGCFAPRAR